MLDGLADWVFTQIALPEAGQPWRQAMIDRARSARRALSEHSWALGLIESRRTPGPALLRHHDAVLGCLRADGFTIALAAHAFSALDAYVYGFVLTELNLPFEENESAAEFVRAIDEWIRADRYPYLVEMINEQVVGKKYATARNSISDSPWCPTHSNTTVRGDDADHLDPPPIGESVPIRLPDVVAPPWDTAVLAGAVHRPPEAPPNRSGHHGRHDRCLTAG